MNSYMRLPAIPLRVAGEFSYVNNYHKNGYEKTLENQIYNTINEETYCLKSGSNSWQFDFVAQPINYSLADPDKALFENNITERLALSSNDLGVDSLLLITIT